MARRTQRYELRLSPDTDQDLIQYLETYIAQSERFGGTRSGVLKAMVTQFMENHPNGLIDTLTDLTDSVVPVPTAKHVKKSAEQIVEPEPELVVETTEQAEIVITEPEIIDDTPEQVEQTEPVKSVDVPDNNDEDNVSETVDDAKSDDVDHETQNVPEPEKEEVKAKPEQPVSAEKPKEHSAVKNAMARNSDLFNNPTFQTR